MIAAFKLAPFTLAIALLLTASTFAQTVLWDFETAGAPPPGWTPGWNAEDNPLCSPEVEFPLCDMQHLPWKAEGGVEGGVLIAPEYVHIDGEMMDSFVLSPVFMSLASPAIARSNGIGGPILTFSLEYDAVELERSGQSQDLLEILLLKKGSTLTLVSQLIYLPLNDSDDWIELDGGDGTLDQVIMVEEPLEASVQYRLRVRAVDSDFNIATFDGLLGIDNIAVTNGVIVGSADFDDDGDVDGRDFLVWQRNPGVGSLADWQEQFGEAELSAVSVPEPSALLLGVLGLLFAGNLAIVRI